MIEILFGEIIAEKSPNLGKETDIQIQGPQRSPTKFNPRMSTAKHIVIKKAKSSSPIKRHRVTAQWITNKQTNKQTKSNYMLPTRDSFQT